MRLDNPECVKMGCTLNFESNVITHNPNCPLSPSYRETERMIAKPAPVASNVASLRLARVDKGTHPRDYPAMEALDMARDWIREAGQGVDHIIVFLGRTNGDNSSGTKYFQSGSFSAHAQVGLVYEALDLLRNS